ncbi:MAG: hypothetical protein H7234_04550 [Herminiimonas sp.]|nr:hypothetical protein [Herminiimonas sp.]
MTPQPPSKPFVIDQAYLRRARNLARQTGRSVIAELEQLNNGSAEDLVLQLAKLFGMNAVTMDDLQALVPAFDLLGLALARRWGCLLMREPDGTLVGVLSDPFDPDLQLWLNSQAHGAVLMRLAASNDLQMFLARHDGSAAAGTPNVPVEQGGAPAHPVDAEMLAESVEVTRALLRRAMRR